MLDSGFLFCIQFDCIYRSGVELWVGVVEGHLESCVTNISKEYIKLDTEIRSNLELFRTVSYPYSLNTQTVSFAAFVRVVCCITV